MKCLIYRLTIIVLIASCRQADTEYSNEELVNPESVMAYEEGDTLVLRKMPEGLSQWLRYYQQLDTGFTLRNFKASGVTLHMDGLPDAISPPTENSFSDLFLYSPDSTQYLDLVSYNFLKEEISGRQVLISGDPDQQVVIADSRKNVRKQLMYNGPSQLAEFANWTGNQSFLIGMTERRDRQQGMSAELYFFHLKDSSFTNFVLNHTVAANSVNLIKNTFLEQYFKARNYEIK